MLRTRLLTAAVALPLLLAIVFFSPDWIFSIFVGALGAWGLYEVFEITAPHSFATIIVLIVFGALPMLLLLAGPMFGFYPPPYPDPRRVGIILIAVLAIATINIASVATVGPEAISRGPLLVGTGALYVGPLFPFFALLRNGPNGIKLLVLMLLLVICADSGAYFVGKSIGRHKLAFKVSPGKTIEGAIGGIAASILAGLILRSCLSLQWSVARVVIFSTLAAVLAIIGDLANSAFKRIANVKDSGWIFPGHGGLLDRSCSLVFVVVLTYYYSR